MPCFRAPDRHYFTYSSLPCKMGTNIISILLTGDIECQAPWRGGVRNEIHSIWPPCLEANSQCKHVPVDRSMSVKRQLPPHLLVCFLWPGHPLPEHQGFCAPSFLRGPQFLCKLKVHSLRHPHPTALLSSAGSSQWLPLGCPPVHAPLPIFSGMKRRWHHTPKFTTAAFPQVLNYSQKLVFLSDAILEASRVVTTTANTC